ncbi:DUF2680 domain-containing protein [Peribacillus huizhouensis]|uniref:DUF2680 domain-containing protein n=1 Tax=Peribacillus huizhouensis TaxID=1501239 RepID=A0ABR6CRN1_9BACI|nr:DUF2680 domain-containing protein [Peribacillus huizhouensis]MBA9026997.1 hypothetical protein [Peribacillus huizhouensis]
MNKLLIAVLTITFVTFNFEITALAETDKQEPQIVFTEKQQEELAVLHKEILEKKKEIVQKYVEYGVISKEKAAMIVKHMERHYQKIEENKFQPFQPHHKKKPAE